MLREFQKFIMRGNVLDLAVGIIIGASFTSIVNSLVNDVIMPPIGLVISGVDFSDIAITLREASGDEPAVTIGIGAFINAVIQFVIVAFVVFLIVRSFNRMMERFAREEKAAPVEPTPDPLVESQKQLTEAIDRLNRNMEQRGAAPPAP
jgi:large conductance mechanosensitive channel